ncbi:MAG: S8 family serine peptidase [Lachnospiraceae bacterium]|nr:S8 family serine peptidase [Lachnospiraceae bacterium]
MSQKFENLWNLALETQKSVREKTNDLNVGYIQEENAWEVIVKYHGEIGFLEEYGIEVEELIAGYGILKVPASLVEMLALVEQIEYVEKPKRYYFEEALPGENSCVYPVTLGEEALTGADILIAIPDSGIDYRRREFRNEDGSSRILYLWDQTLVPGEMGAPPEGFRTGVEFSKAQIDGALQQESGEGFLAVSSRDVSGHGTAVAGIAAAGRIRMEDGGIYQGIAPESQLIVVKLGTPGESDFLGTTEIMRAVTYAVRKGIELRKPVVINLSFGNSYGSHDGGSLVERFLDNAAEIGRTVICVGAGNEGDSGGHFAGDIRNEREVEIAVGEYERTLSIQLWKQFGDVYAIRLQAPDNTIISLSDTVNGGKQEFELNETRILVYVGEPKPYSVLQEIYFDMVPLGERRYIASGIWKLEMVPVRVITGKFDCYLPASEARNSRTGFLRATPEMTLTVPSTTSKIVTVGAYNASFEQYAAFSGRGLPQVSRENSLTIAGLIKPDLVAPGVDILAPDVRGGFGQVTGTSFATPIVSGSAALLMEWGIVRGNDRYLYGEKVKAYLRRGAQPLRGENAYPNERVGFGKLCVAESFPVL